LDFENTQEIQQKLRFCKSLGIKNLILEPKNNYENWVPELKSKIEKFPGIQLYYRFNLKPPNLNEFKKILKKYKNFPYILSIESLNKDIQIQAAKDSRIDLISFSDQDILKTITPGVISLTKQNKSFIEFSLSSIMAKNKANQSKNFRNLYRFIQLAIELKANYIISGNFEDLYNIRNPRALISICHTLLGMPLTKAKNGFSNNVIRLLKKVELRQDSSVIETGVRFIKGGE